MAGAYDANRRDGHPRVCIDSPRPSAFGRRGADVGSGGPGRGSGAATIWPASLADATVGSDGWVRAVGYHEAVAGPLDRGGTG